MSVSIGIGIEVGNDTAFFPQVVEVAHVFRYGFYSGLENFEEDVRDGIETLGTIKEWKHVYCLKAPEDAKANMAFGIHDELTKFQTSNIRPKFFDFCEALGVTSE